jgi:superfamily II RNA helicase
LTRHGPIQQSKSAGATAKAARASGVKQQRTKWVKMIDQLRVKGLLPVVVFAFSKKKCEVPPLPPPRPQPDC